MPPFGLMDALARIAAPHMIYLFTRNSDGSVVSSSHSDLRAARSALETFVSTARKFGYQIEPSTLSDELNRPYSVRSGTQLISYWLSESAAFAGSKLRVPSLETC